MNTVEIAVQPNGSAAPADTKTPSRPKGKHKPKPGGRLRRRKLGAEKTRTRAARPYPASSFKEAAVLGEAIHKFASGQRVRRLTLLHHMEKSPTSSSIKMLITNSGKYKITTGSYAAEWLALTEIGARATAPGTITRSKLRAQFTLAIEGVRPFNLLYNEYKGKRLPSQDVMKDLLAEKRFEREILQECVDTFVVNAKDLGLIQTLAGSETLFPVEHQLDDLPDQDSINSPTNIMDRSGDSAAASAAGPKSGRSSPKKDWSHVCFVITAIGNDDSEERKHSDLFLSALIEPALKEFNLEVVRADKIGDAGMITSQVLEHLMRSRLAIADLSFHNPNAFYEMAVRHTCALPIVHAQWPMRPVPAYVTAPRKALPLQKRQAMSESPRRG